MDNYKGSIDKARFFFESTWPKIATAYDNRGDDLSGLSAKHRAEFAALDKELGL
jgi:hypothetical protein